MGEYETELYSNDNIMNTGILRLNNVYGPNSDLSKERSQVIPSLIRKAIKNPNEKFVVWGNGEQSRDFIFVSDVVEALLAILEKGLNKGPIQVGNETKTKISQIAEMICKISGKDISIEYDASRLVGDFARSSDITRAKEILNWTPKTSLEDGLSKTYEWAENFLKEYQKITA